MEPNYGEQTESPGEGDNNEKDWNPDETEAPDTISDTHDVKGFTVTETSGTGKNILIYPNSRLKICQLACYVIDTSLS